MENTIWSDNVLCYILRVLKIFGKNIKCLEFVWKSSLCLNFLKLQVIIPKVGGKL